MAKSWLFSAIAVCGISLAVVSCAMDPDVISIWGGDISVPKLLSFDVISGTDVQASFSAPVTVTRAQAHRANADAEVIPVSWQNGESGTKVIFSLTELLSVGVQAVLAASVKDQHGNTLSFAVPYTGFNARVPLLRINEIRTEYSKPKVEFIELYVSKGGNLSGVAIQNTMNTAKPLYEFPPVEVSSGDYIVYHLRSVEEGLVDETGEMDASAGTEARPFARDFWDNQSKAPLKKTNVILLRERNGGPILDAFISAEADTADWPTDAVRLAAEEACAAGAWLPGSRVTDAFCATGATVTRTMGRNERSSDTDAAGDWKICPTSKCSPGATNVAH